jgi:hypothetical protein
MLVCHPLLNLQDGRTKETNVDQSLSILLSATPVTPVTQVDPVSLETLFPYVALRA